MEWKGRDRESEVAQCPTLSDPMDCSSPGSSVHGIFQAEYWSGVPLPSPMLCVLGSSDSGGHPFSITFHVFFPHGSLQLFFN